MDRAHPPVNRRAPALLLALLLLGLPACSLFRSPVVARGNRPTEEQIKDISIGVHTRNDVQALLGSPTASSTFGDASWYYISARTTVPPLSRQAVAQPETVAVDFNDRGVVQQVRVLREADMPDVTMVSRETPTPGNDRTLLQALFGNIGRFGTGALSAETNPGAPGLSTTR